MYGRILQSAVALLVVLTCAAAARAGTTLYVDTIGCQDPGSGTEGDPFCRIQDCIDAAVDGDECVVAPGTYSESIDFSGKAITLRSSDGLEVTIIGGSGGLAVVLCVSREGPDTVLDGFTITSGGFISGMRNELSSPTVINCTFSENYDLKFGGGMLNFGASPTVTNCTFRENISPHTGAGMINSDNSNPIVTNCLFIENVALQLDGGGMLNTGSSSPTITNCTFSGNMAVGSSGGGGMENRLGSSPTITHCTFSGNTAHSGGGMYNVGGGTNPTITNCIFTGNTGLHGGAMRNGSGATPTVTNCTFSGNTGSGAMLNNDGSSVAVTNCVLWGNSPVEIVDEGETTVTFSIVKGGWPGEGNIDADPLFVDPDGPDKDPETLDDNDFRLAVGSPAIDAADNTAVPGNILTDLDDNPRFVDDPTTVDTGNGPPPIVDMGAYEFQQGCGNGIVEGGEECDDGVNNSDTEPDGCRTDCTLHSCGDAVVDTGEECDDEGESSTCDIDCTLAECGDGLVNETALEECDDGAEPGDCCQTACRFGPEGGPCGDGPDECSDQATCNANGVCIAHDLALGTPCGAPADMPGSCFTGDECSGGGVCIPGTTVTSCIDDDLCCNRDVGCNLENDNDCEEIVPTVSTWGLIVLALLLVVGARVHFGGRWHVQL